MFNLSRWSYLIYAALAAFVSALKGYLYAHLLDEIQYAGVNYYLLMLGVGVLVVGSGVMVRCHTELPLLVKEPASTVLDDFIAQVKRTGFLFWLLLCPVVLLSAGAVGLSVPLQLLSVVQVLVFFLFSVDLMVVKSRLEFVAYAKQLFVRNVIIAAVGFLAAYLTADATWTVAAEVGCAVLFYGRKLICFAISLRFPTKPFLLASMKFVPVTMVGALLQFVDRLLASSLLSAEQFSRFSYLSLIVLVGLSIQQLVNTRIITVLPEICQKDSRSGFTYVVKASGLMAALLVFVLVSVMLVLQSPWFAAAWFEPDYNLGFLFVLVAILRSSDFYTAYLLVMNQKSRLFLTQMGVLLLFGLCTLLFKFYVVEVAVFEFVLVMLVGFFAMLVSLFVLAWRVSGVDKNAG